MSYDIIYIIYESLGSNTTKFSGYLNFFSFENLQKHVLKKVGKYFLTVLLRNVSPLLADRLQKTGKLSILECFQCKNVHLFYSLI